MKPVLAEIAGTAVEEAAVAVEEEAAAVTVVDVDTDNNQNFEIQAVSCFAIFSCQRGRGLFFLNPSGGNPGGIFSPGKL